MASSDFDVFSSEYAKKQDEADSLSSFRSQFLIPSKADLKRPTLSKEPSETKSQPSTYLCGNSLGLQPTRTSRLIETFLTQWGTKGVKGHFVEHSDSSLAPFLHIDDHAAKLAAPIVGALESEVAIMGTLTANLHILMASFYRPGRKGEGKWKIMLEGKAFPSDHFAIESQIVHHGLDPEEAMILLEPSDMKQPLLETSQILEAVEKHASETSLILLPGIQFYTGQYFDIPEITACAHKHDIIIGWDLAHAAGNVELSLHDWNVDFAAWCNYKYLNSGPGAMAGIFIHDKFGHVDMDSSGEKYRPRLTGWWGDDKNARFAMTNRFVPRSGAAGYQLSNPSALDLAAVTASLQIFNEASMPALRKKSLRLTAYLEQLLIRLSEESQPKDFAIISPKSPEARGAQLSIRLRPGLLNPVLDYLDDHGVIIDERQPDVIRVAPAPLYNTFSDVLEFCRVFKRACKHASHSQSNDIVQEATST